MKRRDRRWRLMADVKIQGWLCVRVIIYWMSFQLCMSATMVAMALLLDGSTQSSSASIWNFLIPGLIVSALILPIALLDLLFFSNRFAGPMLNFRRTLQQLNDGGTPAEFRIRKDDFCADFCEQLNQLRTKVITESNPSESPQPYREFAATESK